MSHSPIALRAAAAGILAALVLFSCSSEPVPDTRHLGHWESVYRGRGGVANGLVLNADSTVDRYNFFAFDFHFSAVGDSLQMVPILPDSLLPAGATAPPAFTTFYSVAGDTLIRSDAQRTEWLTRQGAPAGDPGTLLGTWKVVRSTGDTTAQGYERFGPDSVLQVRVPKSVTRGTYSQRSDPVDTLKPDSIIFFFPADTSRCELSWSADTLQLTRTFTNGTFKFGYLRVGDSIWYPKEAQ